MMNLQDTDTTKPRYLDTWVERQGARCGIKWQSDCDERGLSLFFFFLTLVFSFEFVLRGLTEEDLPSSSCFILSD